MYKLKDQIKVDYKKLYKYYFLEIVFKQIATSKYKDNFIAKRGFLLSNIFGLRKRRTYDIDYSLVKEKLNQDSIAKMLNDIFMNKNEENIKFEISNIKTNVKRNKYSGLDVSIKCILATIEEIIHLDISTGDTAELFNREYTFMYQMNNNVSKVHVYKNELIIAQKLQTMMYFDYMNSRIKDYYDVF